MKTLPWLRLIKEFVTERFTSVVLIWAVAFTLSLPFYPVSQKTPSNCAVQQK
jgi:hypothetical protein